MKNGLATISRVKQQLAQCVSVDEAKGIRDKAQAIRVYLKQRGEGYEVLFHAAEIKLRAERRLGELIKGLEKNRGGRPRKTGSIVEPVLADGGYTKKQSHRWQMESSLPEKDFRSYMDACRKATTEPASATLYKLCKQSAAKKPSKKPPSVSDDARCVTSLDELEGEQFGTIYADPPWQYGNQGTRAATDNHYTTMSIEKLCEMPVASLAAEKSHLHLWTTNAFLFDARQVLEAWGFEYKSCFVWVKSQMGIGNYWRVSHEFMLLGVRGSLTFSDKSLMSWMEAKRGNHSKKPSKVRDFIERASPDPRLEMFGREPVAGWTVFGNQIENRLFT